MFKRIISFLAALFVSAPADAKQSLDNPVDVTDIEARIGRAQEIIEKLDRPIDYGGVTRDKTDLNKMAWGKTSNNEGQRVAVTLDTKVLIQGCVKTPTSNFRVERLLRLG